MPDELPVEFQTAWRTLTTRDGRRYDYQYDGRCPTVRAARYEDASDYMFLLMDPERRLYRIPVRVSAAALALVRQRELGEESLVRLIERHLHQVLDDGFVPRANFPYDQLDGFFAVDAAAMVRLLA